MSITICLNFKTFDYLLPLGIDLYKWTNELNSLLDIAQVRRLRKRSPGDGLLGLIKDSVELIPIDEMKQAYTSKLKNNPKFKVPIVISHLWHLIYTLILITDSTII